MKHYVGIDLGTTNSAICSYDGESVRLHKSPEQSDVTPSALFIDRRGNKYLGKRAYDSAARSPDNAATRFKRMMGTSTPIRLPAVNLTLTPEECSAEILRLCFGYLPDEVRDGEISGTVITVPAAFNQMQKDATLQAANMANLGSVALMQEPVAAVMSVMRQRRHDGIFLVFDLGGGTLDVAIAESVAGRVALLAHGGVAMCGGADFDRAIIDQLVRPWLHQHFKLPQDLAVRPEYGALLRMCAWAAEKAKIELSSREDSVISLNESDLGVCDLAGAEMYVDLPITRGRLEEVIRPKLDEAIASARETLERAGLAPADVQCVVFVGGPTQYRPLRDRVAKELGIAASTEVNPMTAVAEGAAVFAESIDWTSASRGRKKSAGAVHAGGSLDLSLQYVARTPDARSSVSVKVGVTPEAGTEFQVDSLDTGWSSGRMLLVDGATAHLPLARPGDNLFKIFVFDPSGGPVRLMDDRITICRTAVSVDAIPASHSIGVEARDRAGGRVALDYLVREGDRLPKKGRKVFRAEEALQARAASSIRFKLWEGEIDDPVSDNRFIGMFEIKGSDFDQGRVAAGAELVCEYEIRDSGSIAIEVTVPSIGGSFRSSRNFYARQDAQIDFSRAGRMVLEQARSMQTRIVESSMRIRDPRLDLAQSRVERAAAAAETTDPEVLKQAMDDVQEARRLLALARHEHVEEIRTMELEKALGFFAGQVARFARPDEITAHESLVVSTQRAITSSGSEFDSLLGEMQQRFFEILWRQDWFVIDRFRWLAESAHLCTNLTQHAQLVSLGEHQLAQSQIQDLRTTVRKLDALRMGGGEDDDMLAGANILRS